MISTRLAAFGSDDVTVSDVSSRFGIVLQVHDSGAFAPVSFVFFLTVNACI